MALATGAIMTFVRYELIDDFSLGVKLYFTCSNPGPGELSEYWVIITDDEVNATTTNAQLRTLVTNKLTRKYRTGVPRLDNLIGSTITI